MRAVQGHAVYRGHRVIVGPGLDEALEGAARVVVLDPYYAEVYSEYAFLGYEVAYVEVEASRADLVGLAEAALLLVGGRSVVVCGDRAAACALALAAHGVLEGSGPVEALREASEVVARLYGGRPRVGLAGRLALRALSDCTRLLGSPARLASLLGVAEAYEYGLGRLHYGEHVSWTVELGAPGEVVAASLLHFLVEGRAGSPRDLLRLRLEAVGDGLAGLLGRLYGPALGVLEDYVGGRRGEGARLLELVERLGPGEPWTLGVRREGRELHVYCRAGGAGEPDRACVEGIARAAELLPLAGLERLRTAVAAAPP